jgi:hypothetical protein
VLVRGGVRLPGGAQGGANEAGGGPVCSSSSTLRHLCFDDNGAGLGLEGGGGAYGTAAQALKA